MRLGLDVHMLGERHTGVAVYVSELVAALERLVVDRPDIQLELFGRPADAGLVAARYDLRHPRLRWTAVPGTRYWTSVHLPRYFLRHRRAIRRRLDAILFPAHSVPPCVPVPALVTILDTAFETFAATFPARDRHRLRYLTRTALRRARGVLAISEATARDVISTYGIHPDRIRVTPLAVDTAFFGAAPSAARVAAVAAKHGLVDPYVLAVGTLQPRKNYARLMDAVARLRARGLPLQLVLCGGVGWAGDRVLAARAAFADPSFIVLTGYVDRDDLPALYRGARLSAQVGLHEGFGLPVLEAFAAGVPTVVADAGALPEVAGDAAVRVDPNDPEAIADALAAVATDAALRARLVDRMPAQLAKFNWRTTAERTVSAAADLVRP